MPLFNYIILPIVYDNIIILLIFIGKSFYLIVVCDSFKIIPNIIWLYDFIR